MANRKLIIGGALVGLAAINVIGAKIIGSNIESGVKASVAAYSEQLRIDMEVDNFESSWFSSKFQLKVSVPGQLAQSLSEGFDTITEFNENSGTGQIIFDQNIKHGPITWTRGLPRIGLAFWQSEASLTDDFLENIISTSNMSDSEIQELRKNWPQIKSIAEFDLIGSTSLFGTTSNTFKFEGGYLNFANDGEVIDFTINPLELEWTLNSSYDASDIDLMWEGMRFKGPEDLTVNIGELSANSEVERVKPGIWLGNSEMQLGSITGTGPDETEFDFSGLDAISTVDVDLDNNNFSVSFDYDAGKFALKSTENNFDFNGFDLKASATEVPIALLEKFLDITQNLQNSSMGMEEMDQEALEWFKEVLATDYNGDFEIDINVREFDGNFTSNLQQGQVDFKPLKLDYRLNNKDGEVDYTIDWQGMTADVGPMGSMSIEALTSKTHQFRVNPELWLGNGDFKLSNFKFKTSNNMTLNIETINSDGKVTPVANQENADVTFFLTIENVAMESPMGDVTVKSYDTDWTVSNIPFEILEAYQDYNNPFKPEYLENPERTQRETLERVAATPIQPVIKMNKFDVTLNEGTLKSSGEIDFNEPVAMSDPNFMQQMNLNADVELTEAFVSDVMEIMSTFNPMMAQMPAEQRLQMAQAQLMQMVQQGLLVAQDDGLYTAKISKMDNFIAVNGNPMYPLPAQ